MLLIADLLEKLEMKNCQEIFALESGFVRLHLVIDMLVCYVDSHVFFTNDVDTHGQFEK